MKKTKNPLHGAIYHAKLNRLIDKLNRLIDKISTNRDFNVIIDAVLTIVTGTPSTDIDVSKLYATLDTCYQDITEGKRPRALEGVKYQFLPSESYLNILRKVRLHPYCSDIVIYAMTLAMLDIEKERLTPELALEQSLQQIRQDETNAPDSSIATEQTKLDLNDFKDAVYQLACKNGKYDMKPMIAPLLMHLIGEANEAHLAYSANNHANPKDTDALLKLVQEGNDHVFKTYFKAAMKSTFEDELSDMLLMVLSIAGYYNVDIVKHAILKHKYNKVRHENSAINNYHDKQSK